MNTREMTAQVLSGKSPRYIIESSVHHRWEQLGRKLDATIRAGGIMAGAAAPMFLAYSASADMRARALSFSKQQQAYAAGHLDLASARGKEGFMAADFVKPSKRIGSLTRSAGRAQLAAAAMAGLGAAGVIGAAGTFKKLGAMVDKRKFAKALRGGIRQLIKDADPDHKRDISEHTVKLAITDPFAEPKKYSALLRLLSIKLTSYRDARYNVHIESIQKFLEVLP